MTPATHSGEPKGEDTPITEALRKIGHPDQRIADLESALAQALEEKRKHEKVSLDTLDAFRREFQRAESAEQREQELRAALENAHAIGDTMQSSLARVATYVDQKAKGVDFALPYEEEMAAAEGLSAVDEWTRHRVVTTEERA